MKTRPLTSDDRALIRALRVEKGWGALRMMKEFPSRQWKRSTLNDLSKRIDETSSADRKRGTGRHRSVRILLSLMNLFAVKVNQAQVSRHEKFHVKPGIMSISSVHRET